MIIPNKKMYQGCKKVDYVCFKNSITSCTRCSGADAHAEIQIFFTPSSTLLSISVYESIKYAGVHKFSDRSLSLLELLLVLEPTTKIISLLSANSLIEFCLSVVA
jgi:hypothetical protein